MNVEREIKFLQAQRCALLREAGRIQKRIDELTQEQQGQQEEVVQWIWSFIRSRWGI